MCYSSLSFENNVGMSSNNSLCCSSKFAFLFCATRSAVVSSGAFLTAGSTASSLTGPCLS